MHGFFHFLRHHALAVSIVIALLLLILSFFAGRWSVYRVHPELSGEDQAGAILQKVGQLIQLPQNETPSMATINDAASAKAGQPFLKDAENGDVLIVYSTAGEAILYRPSTNKLVAVGPVTSGSSDEGDTTPAPKPTPPPEASTTDDTATSS
jgi:hypothetical protein